MNKTVAVVVTYNRIDLLKECIAHLYAQTVPVDIMVIDNDSTDGTSNLFQNSYKDVIYFNTGANLGGAGGFNYGMRKACELGYEFVWVMDDDTMPESTALEKMLEADQKLAGNYGWLSSLVLWKDNTPCKMNIQKINKWKKLKKYNDDCLIQYASFVSLFLKKKTIKKAGLPYKEFFIWGDDWEYTRRISKMEPCYFVSSSIVYHECKTNNGPDITKETGTNFERYAYSYRNDVVIYKQDGFEGLAFLFAKIVRHTIRIVIKSENKATKLKLMFNSVKKGLKFKPEVEFPTC